MSGGAHVVRLDHPVAFSEARVIAARLMRDSSVELAEPDAIMHPTALIPNDPSYPSQWNLAAPSSPNLGGANLPNAWSITTGSAAVAVAVIDTGYRPHADLGTVLPGYDFISDIPTANDGDGRDADARDPGDWITAAENASGDFKRCGVSDSSWHGTHVAGTIAALMNNSVGIAGVAPNVKILPVRVLGKCGGFTSDIVDGMRWAAGIAVPGVPANPYPAQVLSMSLGGSAISCSATYQSAVTDVTNAGKVIVVATGNDGTQFINAPADCTGVIAVTAHAIDGDNADYANIGPKTTLSAPGGGCGGSNSNCLPANSPGVYSLWNTGLTVPASDSYTSYKGTSMATPHVAGVVALMFSLNPSLTPAQVKSYLQTSSRPHPSGTVCSAMYSGECGAGLLDAQMALNAVAAPPPTVTLGNIPPVVAPNTVVALSGSAVASAGRNLVSYAWTQQTGPVQVVISDANSANAYFTAPPVGTFSFKLTATDNGGQSGTATAVIRVNSPPALTAMPAQTITQGQTGTFTVAATDVDGDTPIFHSVSLPTGATLSADGVFSWPNATPAGSYTMTYYASDNDADSAQGSVTITVAAASAPPPSGGGGGGGSMDGGALAALALLAVLLRARRRNVSR
jgi:serine protease